MAREADAYAAALDGIWREALAQISGLPDELLNRRLALPETNTLYALATHLAGSTEMWVLGCCAGQTVERDRDAEFRATGTGAELRARFERVMEAIRNALNGLPDGALDRPGDPRADSQFPDRLHTVRDSLLHVVEHASLHLGHLQLTRQILLQGSAGS